MLLSSLYLRVWTIICGPARRRTMALHRIVFITTGTGFGVTATGTSATREFTRWTWHGGDWVWAFRTVFRLWAATLCSMMIRRPRTHSTALLSMICPAAS